VTQTVNVPGVGTLQFPDGMSQADMADAIQRNFPHIHTDAPPQDSSSGVMDFAKNLGSAAVRPVAKAVAGLPLMAMDAGVATRNLVGDAYNKATGKPATPDYELPSSMFNRALDSYTRAPSGAVGKGAEFVNTLLAGGLTAPYLPQASGQVSASSPMAPAGFTTPDAAGKAQALAVAQKRGYVVPPSQSNPTFTNRLLEGIGGKLKLQQEAMQANQPVTTSLAASELGQNPDAPLSQGALASIRQEAVQNGYAPLRNIGRIVPTADYTQALDNIEKTTAGAAKSFPGIKAPDVAGIVAPLRQPSFDSADAIDAISVLRGQADEAFRSGSSVAGRAYKSAAKALEDAIEKHLEDQGSDGRDMLSAFRDARIQIAKSIDVGKSLNDATGQVSATKIGQIAAKAPGRLTGGLKDIATFARAYPKAAREVTETYPSISPLDAYGSAMASASSGSAAPLLLPLTRVGIRNYLLSPAGQARAVPSTGSSPLTNGLLRAIPQLGLLAGP